MEPLAESIISQANIKGVTIGTTEHKINVSNTSLASVSNTLDEFSHVSYYKVNATKSFILPLG